MIVNFTERQFSTRLVLNQKSIDIVDSMKILGTTINNKLEWTQNCQELVKKVNKQMVFLRKILGFGANRIEMVQLWKTYCRSVLEQSAVLWQGALTEENRKMLERTQKTFAKLILKQHYKTYQQSLLKLDLPTLNARRDTLCLNFAKKCRQNGKMAHLFPLNENTNNYELRKRQKYYVQFANTERLKKSPIIYMQNLLNKESNTTSPLQGTG